MRAPGPSALEDARIFVPGRVPGPSAVDTCAAPHKVTVIFREVRRDHQDLRRPWGGRGWGAGERSERSAERPSELGPC